MALRHLIFRPVLFAYYPIVREYDDHRVSLRCCFCMTLLICWHYSNTNLLASGYHANQTSVLDRQHVASVGVLLWLFFPPSRTYPSYAATTGCDRHRLSKNHHP